MIKFALFLKGVLRLKALQIIRTGTCKPDENTETGSFGKALGNKGPTDGRGARIDGLID